MTKELETKLPDWVFKYNSHTIPRVWIYCHPPENEKHPLDVLQAAFERVEISAVSDRIFAFPLDSAKLTEP